MAVYVKIIDKGECYSTLNQNDSIKWKDDLLKEKANRYYWSRTGFYPADGMVGVVVDHMKNTVFGNEIFVVQIDEDIYVPMSKRGVELINKVEYLKLRDNNSQSSTTLTKQNSDSEFLIDLLIGRYSPETLRSGFEGCFEEPGAYYDAFWSDICQILKKQTLNFTIPMYHNGLIFECLMYALDMCREFERKAGYIPDSRKRYIASEVCSVFSKHFTEFTINDRDSIINRVVSIDNFESLSSNIDAHYNNY